MPTDKPRVTAYPDRSLFRKLEKYQREKGIKTLSKAVIAALEDYFEMLEQQSTANRKQTLRELKQEIEEMQTQLKKLSEKVDNLDLDSELEEEE